MLEVNLQFTSTPSRQRKNYVEFRKKPVHSLKQIIVTQLTQWVAFFYDNINICLILVLS